MFFASLQSRPLSTFATLAICLLAGCGRKPVPGKDLGSRSDGGDGTQTSPRRLANFEGEVKDGRGTPLPDVLILAWPKGKRSESVAQARSTEAGHFVLPGLRPGRWMLLVEAAGLGTLETERQVPEDGPAALMLEGESRTMHGVVVDGLGKPCSDARVMLGGPGLRWTRETTSDLRGDFSLVGLGNGRFTLRATRGHEVSASTVLVLDESALGPAYARLTLRAGAFLEGRVLDDQSHPLAGATVDVLSMPADDLPTTVQAERDGRYRIGPIAPGKYQVMARLNEHVLLDAPELQLALGAKTSFDLRLVRTARVRGRVVDESSRPVLGIQVSAISLIGGWDEFVVVRGDLPLAGEAAILPMSKLIRPGGVRTCPTDARGEFWVDGISPGHIRVEILHPDKLPFRREPLLLLPGDVRDLGELVLSTGVALTGQVLDDAEHSVEGAVVEARIANKPSHLAIRVTADGNGQFSFRLPAGDYALSARTEKLATSRPLLVGSTTDAVANEILLRVVPRSMDRASGSRR